MEFKAVLLLFQFIVLAPLKSFIVSSLCLLLWKVAMRKVENKHLGLMSHIHAKILLFPQKNSHY